MNRKLLYILGIFLIAYNTYSQDEASKKNDSTEWDKQVFDWGDRPIEKTRFHYETGIVNFQLNTGYSTPFLHEDVFKGEFEKDNTLEMKGGLLDYGKVSSNDDVLWMDYNYIFFHFPLADINSNQDSTVVGRQSWTYGFGLSDGYGYRLGDFSTVFFYHTMGLNWTKLQFSGEYIDTNDLKTLAKFGDQTRFGQNFESGINFRFTRNTSLNAAYEQIMVFPRHMFWYWTWSYFIETTGQFGVSLITDWIEDDFVEIAPVAYFLLKGSFSYLIYEIRKKNMNWPANSAYPFVIETFKIGLNFNF